MKKFFSLIIMLFAILNSNIVSAAVYIDNDLNLISDSSIIGGIYLAQVDRWSYGFELQNVQGGVITDTVESPVYNDLLYLHTSSHINFIPSGTIAQVSFGSGIYVVHDSNFNVIGTYSNMLDPYVIAIAKDTYQIAPGSQVTLEGYQFNNPGYTQWVAGADYSSRCYDGWSINGESVPNILTYDYLVNDLGLANGTYELRLDVSWDYYENGVDIEDIDFFDYDITTITIVPEPGTILFLTSGVFLLSRKR